MRHVLLAVLAGAGILAGPLRAAPSWESLRPDRVRAADPEMFTPVRWHRHRHWRRQFRGLVLLPPAWQALSPVMGSSTPWVNPDERSR